MGKHVGNKELAGILGVTPQRINQLVADHGMPQVKRGQYDLRACVQWWQQYQEKVLRDQLKPKDRQDAELKKMLLQAQLMEIELQRELSLVVNVADAQRVLGDAVNATRAKLLALPRRAAGLVMGQTTPAGIETVLAELIHEALTDLANIPNLIS